MEEQTALTIELLPFNLGNMQTWFAQLNAILAVSKIVSQEIKFACGREVANRNSKGNSELVLDTNPHHILKNTILQRTSESEEKTKKLTNLFKKACIENRTLTISPIYE